jgi:hypothetical protein
LTDDTIYIITLSELSVLGHVAYTTTSSNGSKRLVFLNLFDHKDEGENILHMGSTIFVYIILHFTH